MAEPEHNRRASERLQILGGLHGEVMVFQPMAITELSSVGARIETAFPLHLDSLHEFRLTLGDRSVVVKGRVVHSHISDVDEEVVRYLSGIEFVEPSASVSRAVTDFIAAVTDGRRQA